jgi:hypothetical protein
MSRLKGIEFQDALRNKAEVEKLLETIDPVVVRIVGSIFRRSRLQDASVGKEDVMQEVRLSLWKKLPKIANMNITPKNIFKYTTTLIKGEAFRIILEMKYTNPRLKDKRKIKDNGVSLSMIDLEFFSYKTAYPVESLLTTFEERCYNIPYAAKIFEFLTSEEEPEEDYAGLGPNIYFSVMKKMKQLAKEISEEIPYE